MKPYAWYTLSALIALMVLILVTTNGMGVFFALGIGLTWAVLFVLRNIHSELVTLNGNDKKRSNISYAIHQDVKKVNENINDLKNILNAPYESNSSSETPVAKA